jgi:hypothetical protein
LPQPPSDALKRDGVALVCPGEDAGCIARASDMTKDEPQRRIVESTIFRSASGRQTPPQRYTIVLVGPRP